MLIFRSKTNRGLIPILVLVFICGVLRLLWNKIPALKNVLFHNEFQTFFYKIGIYDEVHNISNYDIWLGIALLVLLVLWYTGSECNYRKQLSSERCLRQIFGALIKTRTEHYVIPLSLGACFVAYVLWRNEYFVACRILVAVLATLALWGVSYVTLNLNQIYNLRKQETKITWSQIALLAAFGLWIIVIVSCINIQKDNAIDSTIIAVIGAVLSWIFQDTIKSVAAFFYLRANGLLQIGDLIIVQSRGIEGFVQTISLTTVTVENWDTTTSAFPTYILHSEHFKNSQRMLDGKTHGRLMKKNFMIDTGWIRPLSTTDVERLHNELDLSAYILQQTIKPGVLNMEAFRQYIYHWLMKHPYVSQQPRLIVRWLEQTDEGMPLQLFVYLTKTSFEAFEWEQSYIIEHVIKTMGWFNLQLYQSPSGYDASNNTVFLSNQKATYQKNNEDNAHIQN